MYFEAYKGTQTLTSLAIDKYKKYIRHFEMSDDPEVTG